MAKINNPAHIDASTGMLGDSVLYYRRGQQCMRSHVIPANPDTVSQRVCRGNMKDAVKAWQDLPVDEKSGIISALTGKKGDSRGTISLCQNF